MAKCSCAEVKLKGVHKFMNECLSACPEIFDGFSNASYNYKYYNITLLGKVKKRSAQNLSWESFLQKQPLSDDL